MNNPTNLSELLELYKNEETPVLAQLHLSNREEGYLAKEIIRKTLDVCEDGVTYVKIVDPYATQLSTEIQIFKNPIYLIMYKGVLRAIHHGVISSQRLIDSINRIKKLSIKKAASNEAA